MKDMRERGEREEREGREEREEREEREWREKRILELTGCVVPSLPAVDKLNQNVTNSLPLSHSSAAGTMEPDL